MSPTFKKDVPIGNEGRYQDVVYDVASLDSKGKITPVENAKDHKLELKETVPDEKRNDKKEFTVCTGQCVGGGTLRDHMEVPAGKGHSVVKRFEIDGKAARIYDPASKKAYDFARVDASVKKGFVFTFGNDPQL